jgi:lysophospholipase L1-like esterase
MPDQTTMRGLGARILVLALMLGLGACTPHVASAPRVEVVGDSITFQSKSAIYAALGTTYDVDVQASSGYRIDQMLPAIQATVQEDPPPRDWVFNLGTNDALQDYPGWKGSFDAALRLMDGAACVVLVTVNTTADNYLHYTGNAIASRENALIVNLAATHPEHYVYIDWNGLVQAHPSWLQSDRIHPTATGARELAAWYKTALSVCP